MLSIGATTSQVVTRESDWTRKARGCPGLLKATAVFPLVGQREMTHSPEPENKLRFPYKGALAA